MRPQTSGRKKLRSCALLEPLFFLLYVVSLLALPGHLRANPDVYAALPEDIRVIQYGTGDLDGDLLEELVVLYISNDTVDLALFKAESGHWSLWWTDGGSFSGMEGASPNSVELVDVTGDGRDEILIYSLAGNGRGMESRIITLNITDPDDIAASVLLEDATTPPGYPLFGFENGLPSVTFLKIPLKKDDVGHRRVYCWDGERFERCVEIPWEWP